MSSPGFLGGKSKKPVLGNDEEQPTESPIYDMPLPETIPELEVVEQQVATRMSHVNFLRNQATQKMILCSEKGDDHGVAQERIIKKLFSEELRVLSDRLMEIGKKREDILEGRNRK